jgi:4-amino-4-deoxy-L-arabinose transferase-like glycosyltransferase
MAFYRQLKRKVTNPMCIWRKTNVHIGLIIFLFVLACWMRWYRLDVPFDRDSYDEGVYWQSLRLLAEGHTLYGQIFSSQPPAFLCSILPAYLTFGQSILAARMGVALLSLCGLLGALFVGKVLRGNGGALLALLLLVVSPLYLTESQTLQADAPSTALMLLAIGLAYLWWERPIGLAGYALAVLTANVLALSILSKLFGLADLVPIGLLVLAHLWRTRQQPAGKRLAYTGSLFAGACALLLTGLLFMVPFSGSFSSLWDQVITFHTAAKAQSALTTSDNFSTLLHALATPLGVFALYGTVISLIRRDWHVLPLMAWFLAIFYLLWQKLPLFPHHLVTLVPPLVLLAMMSLGPLPVIRGSSRLRVYLGKSIAIVALGIAVAYFVPMVRSTYQGAQLQARGTDTQMSLQVARDLNAVTRPNQLVITDAPFLAAEADRSTPPQLVDTSLVRIQSGYLSNTQLIQISRQPSVHAVLFYTGRLYQMQEFYLWVSLHFHKVQDYGNERELWTKIE